MIRTPLIVALFKIKKRVDFLCAANTPKLDKKKESAVLNSIGGTPGMTVKMGRILNNHPLMTIILMANTDKLIFLMFFDFFAFNSIDILFIFKNKFLAFAIFNKD